MLNRGNSIQKSLAVFLLVVFAISITPKAFFHDALTRHHDEPVCKDLDQTSPHFHQTTFHCSFDDLVVAAPYLSFHQDFSVGRPEAFSCYSSAFRSFVFSYSFLHTEGRGPPLM